MITLLKDGRAKISSRWIFLKFKLPPDIELLVSEMQKKLGVTDSVSEIKRVENYPYFEILAHIIQHGLRGFIVKNIEGESTETNDLSHILWKWVCCVNNSKCCQVFLKT